MNITITVTTGSGADVEISQDRPEIRSMSSGDFDARLIAEVLDSVVERVRRSYGIGEPPPVTQWLRCTQCGLHEKSDREGQACRVFIRGIPCTGLLNLAPDPTTTPTSHDPAVVVAGDDNERLDGHG